MARLSGSGSAIAWAIPEPVRGLCARFAQAGRPLYLVGGAVRDRVLGRASDDYDLATEARPDEVRVLAAELHPDGLYGVGEKFGTVGLRFGDLKVEVTTFRGETYRPGSRKPEVSFGNSLEADLARRDFTINAMAADLIAGRLIDPFGGRADLAGRVLRAVGSAGERFREDPLRILRACRFAARLGLGVEPATFAAMARLGPELRIVSRERVRDELTKLLTAERPDVGLHTLARAGLLPHALPELEQLYLLGEEGARGHKDVWAHTLQVVRQAVPASPTLRWAALCHDAAKPQTRARDERGEIHFLGHEHLGVPLARRCLERLKADRATIDRVALLVKLHQLPGSYAPDWTDSAVRRLMLDAGDALEELLALAEADVTSRNPERIRAAKARVAGLRERIQAEQARQSLDALQSPLTGDDLMAMFGRTPGPWIKPLKARLREMVIEGELLPGDRERAAALVREWLAASPA